MRCLSERKSWVKVKLAIPNRPYSLCGCKSTLNKHAVSSFHLLPVTHTRWLFAGGWVLPPGCSSAAGECWGDQRPAAQLEKDGRWLCPSSPGCTRAGQSVACCFFFFLLFFSVYFIAPMWEIQVTLPGEGCSSHKSSAAHSYQCVQCHSGRLTWGRLQQPQEQRCPFLPVCAVSWHSRNRMAASVWGYWCAHRCWGWNRGCTDTLKRVCTLHWLGEERKKLAAQGSWTCVSMAPGLRVWLMGSGWVPWVP